MNKDVAVVIGVGGMGQAIARRLGSGRKLLVADFNEATLSAAVDRLSEEGHDVTPQRVDVSDGDSVARLADVAAALGEVTHVVHTAGVSPEQAPTEVILRVDLLGVSLVLEEFERIIASGGAGVVIASIAGHMSPGLPAEQERALTATPARELLALPFLAPDVVGPPNAAYVLAKRANMLRVQAAAIGWGERGARINSVSPGAVFTPMGRDELAGAGGDRIRAMVKRSPAKRLGTPDDVAAVAEFLLAPQAGYVTGTDLLVDGGSVAALRALVPTG